MMQLLMGQGALVAMGARIDFSAGCLSAASVGLENLSLKETKGGHDQGLGEAASAGERLRAGRELDRNCPKEGQRDIDDASTGGSDCVVGVRHLGLKLRVLRHRLRRVLRHRLRRRGRWRRRGRRLCDGWFCRDYVIFQSSTIPPPPAAPTAASPAEQTPPLNPRVQSWWDNRQEMKGVGNSRTSRNNRILAPIGRLRESELAGYVEKFAVPTRVPAERMTVTGLRSSIYEYDAVLQKKQRITTSRITTLRTTGMLGVQEVTECAAEEHDDPKLKQAERGAVARSGERFQDQRQGLGDGYSETSASEHRSA